MCVLNEEVLSGKGIQKRDRLFLEMESIGREAQFNQ